MLKKIRFVADLKKKLHCRTGLAGPEKIGLHSGRAEIFRNGGMNRAVWICDFDGRAGPQN
jgi:hypothetical protein